MVLWRPARHYWFSMLFMAIFLNVGCDGLIKDTEVGLGVVEVPCNICSMIKVRQGRLEWSQIMRSNDVLLGMPYNFIQFTGLQEILAGWLELEMGTYNHYSDSLHLYERDIPKVGIAEEATVDNDDSLSLRKDETDKIYKEIYERMKCLVSSSIIEKEIYSLAQINSEYVAYNNMMLIIASYAAQKNHFDDS